ncbi:MAG: preprotein translocase subunit SecA, partial [Actinobacteria bacterium]|nr:preprotein translocase subunit SecA [Actinomycetota bacterium]
STVEQRNAEIRKNVLKYDEVMNEQRKVIYARRDLVLDGEDLSELVTDSLAEVVDAAVGTFCVSNFKEEWDLEGLHNEINTFWPSSVEQSELDAATSTDELYELLMRDAQEHYEVRENELGTERMREVERQVMLRIIDQRWRDHLREMDYLQDGIGLRAMGQKDPLTEWRREGFEMFEQLMDSVAKDFVRYIMHIQVVEQPPEPEPTKIEYTAPDDQADAGADAIKAVARERAAQENREAGAAAQPEDAPTLQPFVKDGEFDNVGRNDPCPCGSGKKFKQCHGK